MAETAREFTDNSVYIGRDASGTVTGGSHNEVEVRATSGPADASIQRIVGALDDVQHLIDRYAESLPQASLAARDVQRLRAEVQAPEPDTTAVRDTLRRLLDRVSKVSTITSAVLHVKALAAAIWATGQDSP